MSLYDELDSEQKALPGRVVVRFPKPPEKTQGGIFIPGTYSAIPHDVARVISMGTPINVIQEAFRKEITEGDLVKAHPYSGNPYDVVVDDDGGKKTVQYFIFNYEQLTGLIPERMHSFYEAFLED